MHASLSVGTGVSWEASSGTSMCQSGYSQLFPGTLSDNSARILTTLGKRWSRAVTEGCFGAVWAGPAQRELKAPVAWQTCSPRVSPAALSPALAFIWPWKDKFQVLGTVQWFLEVLWPLKILPALWKHWQCSYEPCNVAPSIQSPVFCAACHLCSLPSSLG